MSTNISKEKRERLVQKINAIKTYISSAVQDENTAQLLTYISDIEKDIKGKKYGLVFEEHREGIDETHHLRVGQGQHVAARKQDVPHLRMPLHIVDAGLQLGVGLDDLGLAEDPLARAMGAIPETGVRRHHEHAVGKPLLEPRTLRGM